MECKHLYRLNLYSENAYICYDCGEKHTIDIMREELVGSYRMTLVSMDLNI